MGKNVILASDWVESDFEDHFNKEETFLEAIKGIVANCKRLIAEYKVRVTTWRRIAKGGAVIVWK